MGWTKDEQWILYVENQLAKKTQVSGSLRIDQRPGLQALTEVIESGRASAILVVSVDRITRDPDMITPVVFANLCKRYGVVIITDDYIYDFNNPNRDDMGRFMNEAIASKEYVRKQIKGKMLKNRTRKANMGLVANGNAPVGLMLDESINPKSMHMDTLVRGDDKSGWTIRSRHGLQYILTNPMYLGHLVFNERIVKRNAHEAIVDIDNWNYAFEHL